MKKILTLGAAAVLILSACSKNNDSGSSTGLANNTYKIDNSIYQAINPQATNGFFTAEEASGTGGITFYFYHGNIPTTSKIYRVVKKATADNEIDFAVSGGTGGYYSTDNGGTVQVTLSNGKIHLVLPQTVATNQSGGINVNVAANLSAQ